MGWDESSLPLVGRESVVPAMAKFRLHTSQLDQDSRLSKSNTVGVRVKHLPQNDRQVSICVSKDEPVTDRIVSLHKFLSNDEIQSFSTVSAQVRNHAVLFPSNSTPRCVLVRRNQLSSDVHAEHPVSNHEVERLHRGDGGRGNLDETRARIQLLLLELPSSRRQRSCPRGGPLLYTIFHERT